MKSSKSVNGIIFRISNTGAFDRIIHLLLESGEKKSFLAKGVRKQTSKKSYSIDIGNLVKLKVIEGYAIPIITEIELKNEFRRIKSSYKTITFLQFFCELINKFSAEDIEDKALYKLFLASLENSDDENILLISCIFSLRILKETGHLPDLSKSILTNIDVNSSNAKMIDEHIGYINENDETSISMKNVDTTIYKIQRFIIESNFSSSLRLNTNAEFLKNLLKLNVMWIEMTLDRELKSKKLVFSTL